MTPAVRRLLKTAPYPVVVPLPPLPAQLSHRARQEIQWLRENEATTADRSKASDRLNRIVHLATARQSSPKRVAPSNSPTIRQLFAAQHLPARNLEALLGLCVGCDPDDLPTLAYKAAGYAITGAIEMPNPFRGGPYRDPEKCALWDRYFSDAHDQLKR